MYLLYEELTRSRTEDRMREAAAERLTTRVARAGRLQRRANEAVRRAQAAALH